MLSLHYYDDLLTNTLLRIIFHNPMVKDSLIFYFQLEFYYNRQLYPHLYERVD